MVECAAEDHEFGDFYHTDEFIEEEEEEEEEAFSGEEDEPVTIGGVARTGVRTARSLGKNIFE